MFIYNKTSFYIAVENGDAEVVSVLLNHNKIDVNIPYIFIFYDLIKLNNNKFFNFISKIDLINMINN